MNNAPNLRSIGKFHLIASLGQGGMAKVYLALNAGPAGFNKLMVVKVLRDDVLDGSDEAVRMFWDEARLTAQMVHPNIVHTYEVGEIDGRYYLAMEYLDGQTYRAVQTRSEPSGGLPLREELRILADTARGLHYAHGLKGFDGAPLGVVHRDVSPQNVFITYDGQVKLLDFGIAKATSAENMTQVGVIKGKLDYIAPEQLRGDVLDGRADVFALGAMLWEAVTKQRFAGGRQVTDVAKAHRRIEGSEPNVRMVKPEVPEVLAEIIDKAIAVRPGDRHATAADFADALDDYLEKHEGKTSAKTLAAVLGPMFVAERAAMQKLIDQQVQLTQSGLVELGDSTGDLPRVGQLDQRTSSGLFTAPGSTASRSSSGVRRDLMDATQGVSRVDAAAAPPRTRRSFLIALFLAASAGAAIALLVPRESTSERVVSLDEKHAAPGTEPPRGPSDPPASAVVTQPPVAAEPVQPRATTPEALQAESVIVDLKVTPHDAQVTLDGAAVSLPFSGEFRKSAAVHHLEASAPGHRFLRRSIVFDQDQVIELALEPFPLPAPARRAPTARAPAAPQPAPAPESPEVAKPAEEPAPGSDMPLRSTRTRGTLDTADPYSTQ